MATHPQGAASGYALVKLHATEQRYELVGPEDLSDDAETTVGWDWRIESEGTFQVLFGLEVHPTKEVNQRVVVYMLATFEVQGEPSLPLRPFVSFSAPAILLPYVRANITHLTSQGPFEPLLLSPLNVTRLLEFATFESSTGYEQVKANPELAASLGTSLEDLENFGR